MNHSNPPESAHRRHHFSPWTLILVVLIALPGCGLSKKEQAADALHQGFVYSYKGEFDKAIASFTEAIRLDPKFADAYAGRGVVYGREQGEPDKAIADFNEAIRLDPNCVHTYIKRGSTFIAKGEFDKAEADFTEAIRLDPKIEGAYVGRGIVYSDTVDLAISSRSRYINSPLKKLKDR